MALKIAVAGFRHVHIFSLLSRIKEIADCEIIAACEEDNLTRTSLKNSLDLKITHNNINQMLNETDSDIVVVGDYFGKRGSIIIQALKTGRHVIADKPLCTSLEELDQIEKLAKSKKLKVGCMLDLRQEPNMVKIKDIIQKGCLGEIHAICFGGQHPLMYSMRSGWYFEPGKHGGTINDIAVHGIDIIEWITGNMITEVNAARCWNASARKSPRFEDAAQFMLTMGNGCGVIGDVSYLAPDSCGYNIPYYWEFKFWGTAGVACVNITEPGVKVAFNGDSGISLISPSAQVGQDYFSQFIKDIYGTPCSLNTETVISVTRKTLKIQYAADNKLYRYKL